MPLIINPNIEHKFLSHITWECYFNLGNLILPLNLMGVIADIHKMTSHSRLVVPEKSFHVC